MSIRQKVILFLSIFGYSIYLLVCLLIGNPPEVPSEWNLPECWIARATFYVITSAIMALVGWNIGVHQHVDDKNVEGFNLSVVFALFGIVLASLAIRFITYVAAAM